MFNCILCKKNINFDDVQSHLVQCNARNVIEDSIKNRINNSSSSLETYFKNLFDSVEEEKNINNTYINRNSNNSR